MNSLSFKNKNYAILEDNIPIGWRFVPSDKELITSYLSKKMGSTPLPTTKIIKEIEAIDFYAHHPKNLVENVCYHNDPYLELEWYFFSNRDQYFHGKIIRIKAIGHNIGFWSYSGKEEAIYNAAGDGNVFAYKIHSTFFSANFRKTHWKMEEYRLINTNTSATHNHENSPRARDEWILARISRGKCERVK